MKSEELLRLASLVEEEENSFDALNAAMSSLTDFEDTMFIQWNDEASRSIRSRFAAPREEDARTIIDRKKLVCEDSKVVLDETDALLDSVREMEKDSRQLRRDIEEAEKCCREAEDLCRRCRDAISDFEEAEQEAVKQFNQLQGMATNFDDLIRQRQRVY